MWILNAVKSGDYITLFLTLATRLLILLTIIPLHEVAHGWVAMKLGDPTAKFRGRLTLNPLVHLNKMGALFLILFGFGWANPVPVNPLYFKNRKKGMALTAIAGPISNILAAIAGAFVYYLLAYLGLLGNYWLMYFMSSFIIINISLAVFNLLPMPPLDGSRIFAAILPDRINMLMYRYEKYIQLVLLALLFMGTLDPILDTLQGKALQIVLFVAGLPFKITGLI